MFGLGCRGNYDAKVMQDFWYLKYAPCILTCTCLHKLVHVAVCGYQEFCIFVCLYMCIYVRFPRRDRHVHIEQDVRLCARKHTHVSTQICIWM